MDKIDRVISVPHFTPTFSEALEATCYASCKNLLKGAIFLSIILVLLVYSKVANRFDAFFLLGASLFLVGVFVVSFAVALLLAARRTSKAKEPAGCSGYTFTPSGVDIANDVASAHMSWPGLHGFRRSKRLLMFQMRGSKALMFIPIRCVADLDRAPLAALLADGCLQKKHT
jgi:hypothetical protein